MKLNYKELGEGDPLIIVHGLFGSLDNWMSMAKKLAAHYHIYLVDLRNHGKSPHSEEMNYVLMAQDLAEFIEENELYQPYILGHSMGGKACMRLNSDHPGLLGRLIVVDIGIKEYPPHHQKILAGLNELDLPTLKSRFQAEERISEYIPEVGVQQFLLKGLHRNKEGEYALRYNFEVLENEMDHILSELEINTSETPTLFVRGELSGYIVDDDLDIIFDKFPNSELVTIPNCGHWVHAEKPNLLYNEILSFLS